MTATTTQTPRPKLETARSLWWAIPTPVRVALRARVPLDCRDHGAGDESLIVAVGSGVPLRWLQLKADANGAILCRLWEVRQKTKELAAETVASDGLMVVLLKWAKTFGLTAQ